MRDIKNRIGKIALLGMMASTKAISRADITIPGKWHAVFDNIRFASFIAYGKLSRVNSDLDRDLIEKEEMLDRRMGNKKFYDQQDLHELSKLSKNIDLDT
jgi:hypothetical protein